MHQTLADLAYSALGTLAFALFLLPPGYLAARLAGVHGMVSRSRHEQLLWSIVLSLPIALVLSELAGRYLPPNAVLCLFAALAVLAAVLALRSPRPAQTAVLATDSKPQRATHLLYAAALLWAIYALLALVDIQWGHRIFVSTTLTDWAVRVPMVASAVRGPVPPLNPLSDLGLTPPPLRYYYFWYVLAAQPARLLHLPAGAALAASSVWAGFALLSVTFLSLKYLVADRTQLRRRCLLVLLPLFAIGLDILPTAVDFLRRTSHPRVDMEWWRMDRTPALVTTLLYAPHHLGGLVCCFAAFLLLTETQPSTPASRSFVFYATRALLAGVCFAACAGTSTFIAFIFVAACLLWTLDLLRVRNLAGLLTLAASGIVAFALSRPFLHDMSSGTSAANGFASFAWRSSQFMRIFFANKNILLHHPMLAAVARQPAILLMDFFELGFFAFVLYDRLRTELIPALRGRKSLLPGQRALWAVLLAAAANALFLSSSVTQSANDLGMHSGILVRFVLLLWSVPYLERLFAWYRAPQPAPLRRKLLLNAATACLVLGLIGGLYGMAMNRLYFPLMEAHLLKPPAEQLTADRLSYRLYAIRSAWQSIAQTLPPSARTQFDPTGLMQPAFAYYSTRPIVASDEGCGTPFGGDLAPCIPATRQLHQLFASLPQSRQTDGFARYPPSPEVASADDFIRICNSLSLQTVLVESTDPVWQQPTSWVWTLTPALAEPTVRVYSCPAPSAQ